MPRRSRVPRVRKGKGGPAKRKGSKRQAASTSRSGVTQFVANTVVPAVRKFIATTGSPSDDTRPSWVDTALKYTQLALTAVGYLGLVKDEENRPNPVYREIGGIVVIDLGLEDLIAETAMVGPFMSGQTTEWRLEGSGWISYDRGCMPYLDVTVRPTAQMGKRGGTITIALHPIDYREAFLDGLFMKLDVDTTGARVNQSRIDSFASLASLGASVTCDFDRPISKRFSLPKSWTQVGFPGNILVEAHRNPGITIEDPTVNAYGTQTNLSRYGGRPVCRLYIAYEDTNTVNTNGSDLEDLANTGFEVELRSMIKLMSPIGMPYFKTVAKKQGGSTSNEEVMELSTVNIIRKKPISIISGGNMVINEYGRFQPASQDESKLIKLWHEKRALMQKRMLRTKLGIVDTPQSEKLARELGFVTL